MPIFCNYADVEGVSGSVYETGSEFRLAKIKLDGESPRRWYRSSLFPSQRIYLVYRGLLALYFVAWFIAQVITKQFEGENPKHFQYLTTWMETTLNLHLIASFITCLYGYMYDYEEESGVSTPMSSEVNFAGESETVLLPNGKVRHQGKLRWFHKFSWVLYSFSIDVGFSVTIAFWAILRTEFDAFSWHCHAINSLALFTDLIVSDVPVRILHTCWTFIWGLIYIFFTGMLFLYLQANGVLQKDNFIYEGVLHWGEYNAITCAVVFGVCFGLVPFSQCMGYWIYSAKKKILRKYILSGKSSTTSSNENLKSRDKIHYSGFDQSDQNCATIVKSPQGKAVADLQKEQKRTRRRTNSGLYDKLENLPPSDM
jgi:hypothetical protein